MGRRAAKREARPPVTGTRHVHSNNWIRGSAGKGTMRRSRMLMCALADSCGLRTLRPACKDPNKREQSERDLLGPLLDPLPNADMRGVRAPGHLNDSGNRSLVVFRDPVGCNLLENVSNSDLSLHMHNRLRLARK